MTERGLKNINVFYSTFTNVFLSRFLTFFVCFWNVFLHLWVAARVSAGLWRDGAQLRWRSRAGGQPSQVGQHRGVGGHLRGGGLHRVGRGKPGRYHRPRSCGDAGQTYLPRTCADSYNIILLLFCAKFSLPRPLCSRLRPDVRDRQTDKYTDIRQKHRLMPPPIK